MSLVERGPRRALLYRALAAAALLSLAAGTPFAGTVELPPIDAPVGSGAASAASAPGAAALVPLYSAPAVPGSPAAVAAPQAVLVPASAAVLAPPVASPAAVLAAPAAVLIPRAAPISGPSVSGRSSASFGRRARAPASESAAPDSTPAAGEAAWARSSELFDLSAVRAGDAVPPDEAGLPSNAAGKVLAGLRRAGAEGKTGPGAIPGMARIEWAGATGRGNSGETTNVRIDGKPWFLKRLGSSPDAVIAATPAETRAANEAGFAAVLRADPQLSRSFSVAPRVSVFRDGKDVFVLSEGLPSIGDGESRRQELSPEQRADAAIVQLVLGMGDMHGADVLPLGGGRFGLIDFEKLSRAPLEKATPREIDEQVMLKNFPLVDRLSVNDPVLYRGRFARWKAGYDAGGRARMDSLLAGQGWSRAQREVYLAAVDRNADTFLERLEPYLQYANGWHRRILDARAEAARRESAPRRGFFGSLLGGGKSGR
ncbi:MAG: hypothetical protein KGL74_04585 [Elusimicrobia bacterium]|nr:hypothetical protein [Elusimicrobiota bacterium]